MKPFHSGIRRGFVRRSPHLVHTQQLTDLRHQLSIDFLTAVRKKCQWHPKSADDLLNQDAGDGRCWYVSTEY